MLVEDYQKYARSRGANPTSQDLEKLAASDMEMADKADADAARSVQHPLPADPGIPSGPSAAEVVAENLGYKLYKKDWIDEAPRVPPMPKHPKLVALEKRIKILLRHTGDSAKSISVADRPYAYPAYAHAVVTEMWDCTKRRRRYRGLSDKDRAAAYRRALEDICDRSTGILGAWWVK
jgi:hypothetical protein